MYNKKVTAEKLDEVVEQYCCNKWCLLKEVLLSKHTDPRFLVQIKCIEHRKLELSEKFDYDVGWNIATCEWATSGCAELFAEYYNDKLTAEQIYKKILKQYPIKDAKIS